MNKETMKILLLLFLPIVHCAPATPCCASTKFTVFLIELGGYLDPQTNTPTPVDQTATVYYDYDSKMLKVERDVPLPNGSVQRVTVINNYNTKKAFTVMNGKCTMGNLTTPMTANCIPSNATFLGESRIGKAGHSFLINTWKIQPDPQLTLKISMTKDNCLPFSESMFGTVEGVVSEINYMFMDVKPAVPANIFHLPQECNDILHGPPVGRRSLPNLPLFFH